MSRKLWALCFGIVGAMSFGIQSVSAEENTFNPFQSDTFLEQTATLMKEEGIPRPKFFSREEWGADESLRTTNYFPGKSTYWFDTEIDLVPKKYRPTVTQTTGADDKPLYWPVAEMPEVYKFVVHHTAEYEKKKRDPKEIMRSIYRFHTVSRGWGDIGYNYVIDKDGNIYEGRSGGPKAVGAHVAYHNIGSIGIALMGNFEIEEPTDAQIKVLELLIAHHAKLFDIDPDGRTYYLGNFSYNISGHKDVARQGHGTACPGTNLYKIMPRIRDESGKLKEQLIAEEKRIKRTARDFLKQSSAAPDVQKKQEFQLPDKEPPLAIQDRVKPQIIQRGDRDVLSIEVTNKSSVTWPRNSVIQLSGAPDGTTVTNLRSEEEILPGMKGTFRGPVRVSSTPNGLYTLTMEPIFLQDKILPLQYQKLSTFVYPLQISGDRKFFSNVEAKALQASSTATAARPSYAREKTETKTEPASVPAVETTSTQYPTVKSSAPKPSYVAAVTKETSTQEPQQDQGSRSTTAKIPNIKVKLSFFDKNYAYLQSDDRITLLDERKKAVISFPAKTRIKVTPRRENDDTWLDVSAQGKSWQLPQASFAGEVIEIENYRYGQGAIHYNHFRNQINAYPQDDESLLLINELPMNDYLAGLSEEPITEPEAKRKAILVLARSYGVVYSGTKRKFGTNLYDLEDSPRTSQFYLGYDWERYHPEQKDLIAATQGEVISYEGVPVIGPYFTQSSGHSSAKWKSAYPWAKVQPLPYDEGLEQLGHGVGFSGNSARELGKRGKDYKEILDYFFEGIEVQKAY